MILQNFVDVKSVVLEIQEFLIVYQCYFRISSGCKVRQ